MDHLDKNIFETLKVIMEDEFEMLIETYITDALRHLMLLDHAIKDKDKDVLISSAHSLKGSSSNIGATKLSKLAAELECQAKFNSDRFSSFEKLVNELQDEFKALSVELRSLF